MLSGNELDVMAKNHCYLLGPVSVVQGPLSEWVGSRACTRGMYRLSMVVMFRNVR